MMQYTYLPRAWPDTACPSGGAEERTFSRPPSGITAGDACGTELRPIGETDRAARVFGGAFTTRGRAFAILTGLATTFFTFFFRVLFAIGFSLSRHRAARATEDLANF